MRVRSGLEPAFRRINTKVGVGPLANGEGWYDTIDGCDCAESMVLAFANKLEIWAEHALS